MKRKFWFILLIAIFANFNFIFSEEPASGKHLFILSGQSNMHHMDPSESFTPALEKVFGKENLTIVKVAKTGAAIRYWDKDYPWPESNGVPQGRSKPGKDKVTREEFMSEFGNLYKGLMGAVKKKTEGKTFDSVTFVWMQGESDSKLQMAEIYFDSFKRVVARMKTDLNIESMNIVIGRLSDHGMNGEGWVKMRELQVKFAEETPNTDWVNTDDLNDVTRNGQMVNDLHYTKEGYKIFGERCAEKAIALIQKKK